MSKAKKLFFLPVIISLIMTMTVLPVQQVFADDHFLHDETVTLSNGNVYTIHALDEGYDNNVYLSLRDMATLLTGTEAAFSVSIGDSIDIILGEGGDAERALTGWSEEERGAYYGKSLASNEITVNGETRKYYTVRASYQGGTDCFMSMASLAMILDINMYNNGDNSIMVEPGNRLVITPENLESEGFFLEVNSALVGDATTGQIYYEYNGDKPYAIASTTKLMTCLLTEEAMASGSITEATVATISSEGERISHSADGVVQMTAGQQAPVSELMIGALLPSSNECALTLAELIAGNEPDFVQMMNDKAAQLSMNTAKFYNSNGLPSYGINGLPGKRQNTMSAEDMFKMCSYMLNNYPQIKSITSMTIANLPNLGRDVKNTNALLYNMPEVTGLKTGTTDKAGACLVTSLTVNDGAVDHELVVVVLGAEGSKARFTTSELLARFGKKVVTGEESASGTSLESSEGENSAEAEKRAITSEALVNMIVKGAFKLNSAE